MAVSATWCAAAGGRTAWRSPSTAAEKAEELASSCPCERPLPKEVPPTPARAYRPMTCSAGWSGELAATCELCPV
eukprot:14008641-Alexandrium_andersonii.AAC.1